MIQKNNYRAYVAATHTVAKTQQIVMLYDGAIRFIQQAKEAIRAKRIEERYNLLIKASDIISGMQSCLDFERGGDIARVLYSFYASVDSRLFSVHRTNNLDTCDEVIADLRQMRDVWHEIDKNTSSGDMAGQHVPPPSNVAPSDNASSVQNVVLSA